MMMIVINYISIWFGICFFPCVARPGTSQADGPLLPYATWLGLGYRGFPNGPMDICFVFLFFFSRGIPWNFYRIPMVFLLGFYCISMGFYDMSNNEDFTHQYMATLGHSRGLNGGHDVKDNHPLASKGALGQFQYREPSPRLHNKGFVISCELCIAHPK